MLRGENQSLVRIKLVYEDIFPRCIRHYLNWSAALHVILLLISY